MSTSYHPVPVEREDHHPGPREDVARTSESTLNPAENENLLEPESGFERPLAEFEDRGVVSRHVSVSPSVSSLDEATIRGSTRDRRNSLPGIATYDAVSTDEHEDNEHVAQRVQSSESDTPEPAGVGKPNGNLQTPRMYTPFWLRKVVLLAFTIVMFVLIVVLGALFGISQRNQGLSTASQKYHLLWKYGPTASEAPFDSSTARFLISCSTCHYLRLVGTGGATYKAIYAMVDYVHQTSNVERNCIS